MRVASAWRVLPIAAAASAGVAAWVSIGSLAVVNSHSSARVGLLPPFWLLPVLVIGFAAIAWAMRLSRATSLPLFFSCVLLLPWLPASIPTAFLLWTGRIAVAVWLAVGLGMLLAQRRKVRTNFPHLLLAAGLPFVLYVAAGRSLMSSQVIPSGDEPHYLVISQSLLKDGDLKIENNHTRGDYREYFAGILRPHYLKRGLNGQIYSIHAPGLSAILVPAYALFGYPGVLVLLSAAGALGAALLWRASYLVTQSFSAAWFGWAAGALSVPFFFQAFAVYPDGIAATLVLFSALPLVSPELPGRIRWVAIGAVLGLLPWLHTRFAVISAVLGFVLLLRLLLSAEGRSRIASFLLVPLTSAVAWFGFFHVIYGTFNPTAPYGGDTQSRPANIIGGLPALFFDQQFGIVPNAPIYACCVAGVFVLARRRPRLAVELSAVAIAYLLTTAAFHMWWGGSSSPARFAVPVLPLLVLPGAELWAAARHQSTRAVGLAALVTSVAITLVMITVDGGHLAYNVRDGDARFAEWLSPLVRLPDGLPSFFRQSTAGALLRAGFWVAAFSSAWFALILLERKGATRAALALATPAALALAVMVSLSAVWQLDRKSALRPQASQLDLLQHYDSRVRPIGLTLAPLQFEPVAHILSSLKIGTPDVFMPPGTLLFVPRVVPAGQYELRLAGPAASGLATLAIGRMARPIKAWNLAHFPNGAAELELPVNVGSLLIAAQRPTDQNVLTLHPKQVWEGESRLTRAYARRAQRYGGTVTYFFDDDAFAEDTGFWVRGGGRAQIAVDQTGPDASAHFFLRNAPVANRVTIDIDGHEQIFDLRPREERLVPLQTTRNRTIALVRLHPSTGFIPSEVERGSTDRRFLGVWIEFRQ